MKIIVASTNPVKINAIKEAYEAMFPDVPCTVEGQNPHVALPDQPIGSDETRNAAIARIKAIQAEHPKADFWAAIEGGVEMNHKNMDCSAWIVIADKEGHWGEARTATFTLPEAVSDLIMSGMELGHANDKVFGMTNSKQNLGMTGTVTHGVMNRTQYYVHAAILALVPFKNKDIYFTEKTLYAAE
jgi:inosine/xanthosine triphosphatase